mgnify:CR=1 FL=1
MQSFPTYNKIYPRKLHLLRLIRNGTEKQKMQNTNSSEFLKCKELNLLTYPVSSHAKKCRQVIFQLEISIGHFIEQVRGIKKVSPIFAQLKLISPKIFIGNPRHSTQSTYAVCVFKEKWSQLTGRLHQMKPRKTYFKGRTRTENF